VTKTQADSQAQNLTNRLHAAIIKAGCALAALNMNIHVIAHNGSFEIAYEEESLADGLIPNGWEILARAEKWLAAALAT